MNIVSPAYRKCYSTFNYLLPPVQAAPSSVLRFQAALLSYLELCNKELKGTRRLCRRQHKEMLSSLDVNVPWHQHPEFDLKQDVHLVHLYQHAHVEHLSLCRVNTTQNSTYASPVASQILQQFSHFTAHRNTCSYAWRHVRCMLAPLPRLISTSTSMSITRYLHYAPHARPDGHVPTKRRRSPAYSAA